MVCILQWATARSEVVVGNLQLTTRASGSVICILQTGTLWREGLVWGMPFLGRRMRNGVLSAAACPFFGQAVVLDSGVAPRDWNHGQTARGPPGRFGQLSWREDWLGSPVPLGGRAPKRTGSPRAGSGAGHVCSHRAGGRHGTNYDQRKVIAPKKAPPGSGCGEGIFRRPTTAAASRRATAASDAGRRGNPFRVWGGLRPLTQRSRWRDNAGLG